MILCHCISYKFRLQFFWQYCLINRVFVHPKESTCADVHVCVHIYKVYVKYFYILSKFKQKKFKKIHWTLQYRPRLNSYQHLAILILFPYTHTYFFALPFESMLQTSLLFCMQIPKIKNISYITTIQLSDHKLIIFLWYHLIHNSYSNFPCPYPFSS